MNLDSVLVVLNWAAWIGGLWACWALIYSLLQRAVGSFAGWLAEVRVQYETRQHLARTSARASLEAEAAAKASVEFEPPEEDEGFLDTPMTAQAGAGPRVVLKRRPEPQPKAPDAAEPQVREKTA